MSLLEGLIITSYPNRMHREIFPLGDADGNTNPTEALIFPCSARLAYSLSCNWPTKDVHSINRAVEHTVTIWRVETVSRLLHKSVRLVWLVKFKQKSRKTAPEVSYLWKKCFDRFCTLQSNHQGFVCRHQKLRDGPIQFSCLFWTKKGRKVHCPTYVWSHFNIQMYLYA